MSAAPQRRSWTCHFVIFAAGAFGLCAQTLLFRDFFTAYEGSELGIAAFFCGWLLWVGVGALLARLPGRLMEWAVAHFAALTLLYLPAYLLHTWLIRHSRLMAGVAGYELFPLARILPVSLAANAPVALLTGVLFALACRWMSRVVRLPVARVYITEALGAFAGGVAVTLLLGQGIGAERIFAMAGLLVVAAFAAQRFCEGARRSAALAVLGAAVLCLPQPLASWTRARDAETWRRIMPDEDLAGSFTTPQARYLYGETRGQFNVIAWEGLVETAPHREYAAQLLALHLAQNPGATRFLVIGQGAFAVCSLLTELPQAAKVTWLTPDPAYPRKLLGAMPEAMKRGSARIDIPGEDPRRYLRAHFDRYDVVLLCLPDVTTLALNRYCTREFFELLRERLGPDGVLGVRVLAGENFMGDEVLNMGASMYRTLGAVFAHTVIKPGDETWLLASQGEELSGKPALLRDRFAAIPMAAQLYPPDGLLSLYLPDRATRQEEDYRGAIERDRYALLLNSDGHPRALLHSLLFMTRQGGAAAQVPAFFRAFAVRGMFVALAGLLIYAVLRAVYLLRMGSRPGAGVDVRGHRFDDYVLVASSGAVGMSTSILLMFMFQSAYGALYLYIGLAAAVFMLGLALGGIGTERVLIRRGVSARWLLAAVIAAHLLLLGCLALPAPQLSPLLYGVLFLVVGLLGGAYVPVAAALLQRAGEPERKSGSMVALCDHVGGGLGGVMTGVLLLPLLGIRQTVVLTMLGLAVNLVPLPIKRGGTTRRRGGRRFDALLRPLAYTAFALCVGALAASLLLRGVHRNRVADSLATAAQAMHPGVNLVEASYDFGTGRRVPYFTACSDTGEEGWIFSSQELAEDVRGYGGPLTVAASVDTNGAIRAVSILDSNETPFYLDLLGPWMAGLVGINIFSGGEMAKVDGVTGATLTSRAVCAALDRAGREFAVRVQGRQAPEGARAVGVSRLPDRRVLVLFLLGAGVVLLRRRPRPWARSVFLALMAMLLGGWLNVQYSMAHVVALLGLKAFVPGWNVMFVLAVLLPLLVLLFGNFYCGYLCPFGALQELAARIAPVRRRFRPGKTVCRLTRYLKYVLLCLYVLLFAVTLKAEVASSDLLVALFSRGSGALMLVSAAVLVLVSVRYDRFWCRTLCPTGAFLALLNGARLLRRWLPRFNYNDCTYGVGSAEELDCICCDRCRVESHRQAGETGTAPRGEQVLFTLAALLLALLVGTHAVRGSYGHERPYASASGGGVGGTAREVNMPKLRLLIDGRRLSDHEALYYVPIDE